MVSTNYFPRFDFSIFEAVFVHLLTNWNKPLFMFSNEFVVYQVGAEPTRRIVYGGFLASVLPQSNGTELIARK